MPRSSPMPDIPREQAIGAYAAGDSMKTLAKRYGVSPGWLRRQFIAWGVPLRGRAEASVLRGASGPEPIV